MPNIIEITVRAKTDAASFDAAKAQAVAAAAEADAALAGIGSGASPLEGLTAAVKPAAFAAGEAAGGDFQSAFTRVSSQFTDEQRAAALNWAGSMGTSARAAMVAPLEDVPKVTEEVGASSGAAFTRSFGAEMDKGLSSNAVLSTSLRSIGTEGDPVGKDFAVKFSKAAQDGITASSVAAILSPAGPVATKLDTDAKVTGDKVGKDTGNAAAQGMSPLMIAAFGTVASIGPAAILSGMGAAMVGVTGLVLKSNVTIAADYKNLGTTAATAIKSAAAPLAGDLNQALVGMQTSVQTLTPQFKNLFASAEPDIGIVATGLENFAGSVLPGVSTALAGSTADMAGFAAGLTPLGAGIGSFFTGLTTDSATTGAGLQSVMGVLGNTFGTLGKTVGSASSAISADLLAIDPVINTVLTTVRQLANPMTIGAAGGAFAAFKLDPSISTGLGNAATNLTKFAQNSVDAEGSMSKLGGAASTMGGALSKASGIMSGPWGIAIGAGIGLASGLAGSLIQAAHASDALTVSQQGLQSAIADDAGHAGQATAAYIAQSDAANGLTASAAAAGVSIATWTQAVLGNKQAQTDVTTAVDKLNQSQLGLIATNVENAKDLRGGTTVELAKQAQAANTLTSTNQQLLSSMSAQNAQIASDITKQAQLTAATNALNSSTAIFNATMDAGYQAMVQSATTAGDNAVAVLNLGTGQSDLNQQLAAGVTFYQESVAAAGGYQTILQSLNGTAMSLAQAQNTLAQDELNAATSFKTNKESLDLHTASGIADRQAIVSAATAIQALGVQTYQSTGNMNAANQTIQQQITAFVNATGATGKAKTAIEQYIESLIQIPPDVQTTVTANVGPAKADVMAFLGWVDSEASVTGTIQVNMGSIKQSGQGHAYGGITSAAATGGARSAWTTINEQGQEAAYLPTGTIVLPHANTESMLANAGAAPGGTGTSVVTFNGDTDTAFAAFFMRLYREGKIQIKSK